jgi:cation diffusion facilitator CzcD-associated flavoprotein CzcO
MAGILAAIKLQDAGLTDFTVYEKAARLGGTWRENTYPGIACDVPSHLYSYSFALNPDWSHLFSPGHEIQAYLEDVAARHGVERYVRYEHEVVQAKLRGSRWQLETANGEHDEVDVVIAATGVLHHPRYPDIPGLENFAGRLMHSARFDHDVVLDGARVGIIGTGSTAVQMTSALVERVGHLSLFQRTAQWVMPQVNPPYSEEDRSAFGSDPHKLEELHTGLAQLFDTFSNAVVDAESPEMAAIAEACRKNLEESVGDPVLRERLRPNYHAGCKRLVISTDFYQAIQHPNAELVTERITGIEPEGVRTADGRLHRLDVLVLATGFKVDAFMRPMVVVGRNGRTLDDAWRFRPEAYMAIAVPGFPNFFMLNGPNGPVGNFSLIGVAELQIGYIVQLIDEIRSGACREVGPKPEALAQFEAERLEASRRTVWSTGCHSWYLDDRGVPAVWPWTFARFREEMATPRAEAYERVG